MGSPTLPYTASCGNLFLTGLRLFFGSFESAIYLFRSITGVPESIQVTPCINSNFAHHIAAGLEDGSVISGQNQISHPSEPVAAEYAEDVDIDDDVDAVEDANLPGTIRELRAQNIVFDKSLERPLPARIDRVWYINPYGHEIRPPANPKVVAAIEHADAVVYSIGSLYTRCVYTYVRLFHPSARFFICVKVASGRRYAKITGPGRAEGRVRGLIGPKEGQVVIMQ